MATLKDHQQAMVDLLASGSGIPASASRLAHAMHDVLSVLLDGSEASFADEMARLCSLKEIEATTPGLNDKALAADVEACRIVLTGNGGGPKATPAERRVKELENTVKQLREQSSKYRSTIAGMKADMDSLKALVFAYEHGAEPEQAGCRKDDTQLPDCWHKWVLTPMGDYEVCAKCGVSPLDVYGPKKDDTQVCEHTASQVDNDTGFCSGCGKVVIE